MTEKQFLEPAEIAEYTVNLSQKKASSPAVKLLLLAFIAGVYVAITSGGSTMVSHNLLLNPETYGIGRLLAGVIFGTALSMVIVAGGELFTGNSLMVMGLLERKISAMGMLRNWLFVYIGNFLGGLLIAVLIVYSNLLDASANALGAMTIKIAVSKIELGFLPALILGILCNIIICAAVWMSYGAKSISGKILCCIFPVWLFAASGFEHSVTNMFYIPAGILAARNPAWLEAANLSGGGSLTWINYLVKNLLPVTIGNIIGGSCFIGFIYWVSYLKKK